MNKNFLLLFVLLSTTFICFTADVPSPCFVSVKQNPDKGVMMSVSEEGCMTDFLVKNKKMPQSTEEVKVFLRYVVDSFAVPGYANAAIYAYLGGVENAISVTLVDDK